MPIKILLYEDNNDLRKSIEALFLWNTDFEIVAAMPQAITVMEDIAQLQPDVILMDIDMPGKTGIEAVQEIRVQHEHLPVIMLTIFDDDENIFNAISAGASGYLLKKNFDEIPAAITDVINGGAPLTSSVAKRVLSFMPKKTTSQPNDIDKLTDREKEVLEFIVKGYSYKMIAQQTNITTETVRSHIKKIYKKLQVNSATGAAFKYNNRLGVLFSFGL
jgi:DNA-binding NarL/FixJ family response regulator